MRNNTIILIGCLAALILRLTLAAQAPTLAPEAYDTVRQAEHIAETGVPFQTDPLTPNNEPRTVLPVFPYLVAFGTILVGEYAYILIPNLLAVLLHAALFLLVLELTQNRALATTALFTSIAIPSYLAATLLTTSSLALAIPLTIFILTLFIKLRKSREKRNILLIATVILLATHPIGLLIVPVFLVALAFATIRRARELTIQYDFAIFTTFLAAWSYILLYKQTILLHGLSVIQGNIPQAIQLAQYGAPDLLTFGLAVGVLPFGLAIYAAYKEGAAQHTGIQATIAFTIVAFLATVFKVVPTSIGVTLVATGCIALAAVGLEWLIAYVKTMRETTLPHTGIVIGVLVFIITSIVPTIIIGITATTTTIPPEVLDAGYWLRDNSLPDAMIIAQPAWGSALAWTSKRPVFINQEYLSNPSSEESYDITTRILAGTNVKNLAEELRIEYVVSDIKITHNCLNEVHTDTVRIMKVLC